MKVEIKSTSIYPHDQRRHTCPIMFNYRNQTLHCTSLHICSMVYQFTKNLCFSKQTTHCRDKLWRNPTRLLRSTLLMMSWRIILSPAPRIPNEWCQLTLRLAFWLRPLLDIRSHAKLFLWNTSSKATLVMKSLFLNHARKSNQLVIGQSFSAQQLNCHCPQKIVSFFLCQIDISLP